MYILSIDDIDKTWMRYAIALADYSAILGEVPVGAVLIRHGKIVGYGWNSSIMCNDPTSHAEIVALRIAGRVLSNYRLPDTTMYVTLEPCIMCVGAMIHARIYRLVCGAEIKKIKWLMWIKNLLDGLIINHCIYITTSVMHKECSILLNNFFKRRRKKFFYK